jgi:hypothetical protein
LRVTGRHRCRASPSTTCSCRKGGKNII